MSMRLVLVSCLLVGCGRMGFDPLDGPPNEAKPDEPGPDVPHDGIGDCGDGEVDCTTSNGLPGGAFLRGNDPLYPATVAAFELDRYEVTVGRFREFIEAGRGTEGNAPRANDGAHPAIPGSGWHASWNAELESTTEALRGRLANNAYSTFTSERAGSEDYPINRVTWFEAFAFCIWDGGRLPTHAEFQFAAVGGNEQRMYPWGSAAIDTAHLNASDSLEPVGMHPDGDGRWGHADLVGNVDEWTLDYFGILPSPCTDCANLDESPTRLLSGGWYDSNSYAATSLLHGAGPSVSSGVMGFRCAR